MGKTDTALKTRAVGWVGVGLYCCCFFKFLLFSEGEIVFFVVFFSE